MAWPDFVSAEADAGFMWQALRLAERAEREGEVPVGAVLVGPEGVIAEGWNRMIGSHDPSAHAEIVALRAAGRERANYRLVDTTLYVTLEPCVMCSGAIIHARVARVVYATTDPRTGAAGSAFDTLVCGRHNHAVTVEGGVLAEQASQMLRSFFQRKRAQARDQQQEPE